MTAKTVDSAVFRPIPALLPRDEDGHHFVCYSDSCSGIPGALHEETFAAVNATIQRLCPQPGFICFPGDEISGLTVNDDALRQQWSYWLNSEMHWLDRAKTPLYHTTGNHTAFDPASEKIFREVLTTLPDNGPRDQVGLSYYVRRGNLLMVFVHTLWSGLGGEGHVETEWLEQVLTENANARHKLVFGHHPVFPVNGFSGSYQRELVAENGRRFWKVLVKHGVLAYWCSHILAFDVQVHEGVLQILTAGAGTAHRMPPDQEYLHCVQAALDGDGLRYQVLDTQGHLREWLQWPIDLPSESSWRPFASGTWSPEEIEDLSTDPDEAMIFVWRFSGRFPAGQLGQPQTLLTGCESDDALAPLWIGFAGTERRLLLLLSSAAGRSPHTWYGPKFKSGTAFCFQLVIHTGMGPGGLLWRFEDETSWSSLTGASPWGAERLSWPSQWCVGHGQRGNEDRPFRGKDLTVSWYFKKLRLDGFAP